MCGTELLLLIHLPGGGCECDELMMLCLCNSNNKMWFCFVVVTVLEKEEEEKGVGGFCCSWRACGSTFSLSLHHGIWVRRVSVEPWLPACCHVLFCLLSGGLYSSLDPVMTLLLLLLVWLVALHDPFRHGAISCMIHSTVIYHSALFLKLSPVWVLEHLQQIA